MTAWYIVSRFGLGTIVGELDNWLIAIWREHGNSPMSLVSLIYIVSGHCIKRYSTKLVVKQWIVIWVCRVIPNEKMCKTLEQSVECNKIFFKVLAWRFLSKNS